MAGRLWIMLPSRSQVLRFALLNSLGLSLCAAPANMIFHCLSPKIEPATLNSLGQHRLSFNFSNSATENGELAVLDDDPSNTSIRGTDFTLSAPGFGIPIEGFLSLDTPQTDGNHNGVDDIFEVAQELPLVTTTGGIEFTTIDDEKVQGTAVAKWQRTAGATRGTVQIALTFPGYSKTFVHNFEVFQYRGTMDYQRVGTNVTSTVKLAREGAPGQLGGGWSLHVNDVDSLAQDGGAWVSGRPELKFDATSSDANGIAYDFSRGGLRTNYFGIFQYSNGSPVDDIPLDYALWEIDLFDPNDADGDRFPDLTDIDFTGGPVVAAPQLALVLETGAPRLHLTGTPGANYVVEQKDSLTAVAWTPASTNQPATNGVVEVPLSTKGSNGLRFWRARVP